MAEIIVNLECITNLHVGNGDVNYNIIDNEVERDVTTGYPTINSSGVKGALRAYYKKKGFEKLNEIFGEKSTGELKFLCADMIAIPMRATNGNSTYHLVSTNEAIKNYSDKCKLFLNKDVDVAPVKISGDVEVEGVSIKEKVTLLGQDIYLMDVDTFKKMSLPVLARNHLENGKSENLWYEEVVPHKSRFAFFVLSDNEALLTEFKNNINDKIIQFGGNATIGYGLCKVSVEEG